MRQLFFVVLFLIGALAAKAQFSVISHLENQNIGQYSYDAQSNTLNFSPGCDSLNTVGVWFNFGICGYRTDTVLTIVETAQEYVHHSNFPVVSYDNVDFERIRSRRINGAVSLELMPQNDTMYLAMGYPYTYTMLQDYLRSKHHCPNLSMETLYETNGGRVVNVLTINENIGKQKNKRLVWIICRQHAFESISNYVLEGMIDYLTSPDCDKRIARNLVFKIVPMVDVESVFAGESGRMSLPRDYNRDWDNSVRPIIKAIENEIQKTALVYDYECFWDIHSTFPGGWINFNFSYFDIFDDGEKSTYIQDYWKKFGKTCGFIPRKLRDDSNSYNGTPSDIWNARNFSSLRISSTLEVDWNLDRKGNPWTIRQYRRIGADMIKVMSK